MSTSSDFGYPDTQLSSINANSQTPGLSHIFRLVSTLIFHIGQISTLSLTIIHPIIHVKWLPSLHGVEHPQVPGGGKAPDTEDNCKYTEKQTAENGLFCRWSAAVCRWFWKRMHCKLYQTLNE
jgi:hypothetical protein